MELIFSVMVISFGCDDIVFTKVADKARDIGSRIVKQIVTRIKLL